MTTKKVLNGFTLTCMHCEVVHEVVHLTNVVVV